MTTSVAPHKLEVTLPFTVKTYDIDFAGIVSNIVYIRWLEDLRFKLLETYLPLDQQMARGFGPVLGTTHIKYKQPIRLFDQPVGRMWIDKFGRTSWSLQAEILLDGKVAALASQSGAFVDYSTMRPIPVPADLRVQFENV
jgi:acyl-CoA thioester hydrolase